MLLLISKFGAVQSTPCNSFPKIFGGSVGGTYLNDIDVFNDYLAIAGDIYDSTLAGISLGTKGIPYLALSSISTEGYYYWIKALSLKRG